MPRHGLALVAALAVFPLAWYLSRVLIVLLLNAAAKAQEDFPPRASAPAAWPPLFAAVCASTAVYLLLRER